VVLFLGNATFGYRWYTHSMQTTMKLDAAIRDELAAVAKDDFGGLTLGDALARLLKEHRHAVMAREIQEGYARLQRDPEAWAEYLAELGSLEGLHEVDATAAEEFPEFNR
jgi:hypothetical protein